MVVLQKAKQNYFKESHLFSDFSKIKKKFVFLYNFGEDTKGRWG
jgi:hypothetical protein